MEFDVVVVGASVAGCRTAELIASKGYKVALLEEHEKVGIPSKCAGLVSWRLKKLLPNLPKDLVINTVDRAKFFSPYGNSFLLESRKPVYVIDRKKLDRLLFSRAIKSGCKPFLSTKFIEFYQEKCTVLTTKGKIKTKILVGADGANSTVAMVTGLQQPSKILFGLQATVKGSFEKNCVELWFGRKIAPNFFAWVIPENKSRARIGLATNKNPKFYFEKFLEKRVGKKIEPNVYGLIRFGLMKKTVAERTLLVGDAACMVKPFSGGGIIYSLIGSEICAKACTHALREEKFNQNFLEKVYEKEWKKKLSKAIWKGMFYRRILSKLPDWQVDMCFVCFKLWGRKILEGFDMDFLDCSK